MAQTKGIFTVLGLGVAGLGVYLLTRKATAAQIALYSGWNEVTYTGKTQIAGVAMQSITEYVEVAYYYDQFDEIWKQILYETVLESGMNLNIKVSQDCVWTF